jgi:hypothetical protein
LASIIYNVVKLISSFEANKKEEVEEAKETVSME